MSPFIGQITVVPNLETYKEQKRLQYERESMLKEELAQRTQDNREMKQMYLDVCRKHEHLHKEVKGLKKRVSVLEKTNEEIKKENEHLHKEVKGLKKRVSVLEKTNEEIKKENEQLKMRVSVLEQTTLSLKASLEMCKTTLPTHHFIKTSI